MARRSDTPTRGEVTEQVEKHQEDLREKADDVEETVADVGTVRQTLDALELAGTSEAGDAVEQSIEGAEGVSTNEFNQESQELDQIEGETEEHEEELGERSDTTSSDLGKISDASGRINSDAANGELVKAKEAAMRDIEFLGDQAKRAQEAREESRRLHEGHQSRISAGGRA